MGVCGNAISSEKEVLVKMIHSFWLIGVFFSEVKCIYNCIFASPFLQSSSQKNIFANQIFEDAGEGREKGLELRSVCIGHIEYLVLGEVQMKILNIFANSWLLFFFNKQTKPRSAL